MTEIELFTHPTCSGCQEALTALRALERAGKVTLQVTSLGSPTGRRRASDVGVRVVPTIRLGTSYRLLASPADLDTLLAELTAE
ncbi:MAG TPA: hypothetical protein VF834_16905 [Streptosporangiaceae bacterium]